VYRSEKREAIRSLMSRKLKAALAADEANARKRVDMKQFLEGFASMWGQARSQAVWVGARGG
jgi:hypothetical protein